MTAAAELKKIAQHEPSVILARLTDGDYERFMSAHVPYSGATGIGCVYGYEPVGPYIAIGGRHAQQAFLAMGWTRVRIKVHGKQWIATRKRRKRSRE